MMNPLLESEVPPISEFSEITAEDDQRIIEREFLDEAREMAAQGTARTQMLDVLRLIFTHDQRRSIDEWALRGYSLATDAISIAVRETARALGSSTPVEGPTPIAIDELRAARSSPACFVFELIYADVLSLIGAGGYGKTTVLLFELACLAGGADSLWGRAILQHGPCVLFTAEDPREILVARLRRIVEDNGMLGRLPTILKNLLICDLSGTSLRLTSITNDTVAVSDDIEQFIGWLSAIKPIVVVFDPLVSFGVGESRVNDAEQGLIAAARRLRNAVGCCVTFVHHTGKQNAREGSVDQYAGRGGSALSDGSRMVHVLTRVSATEWKRLVGSELDKDDVGLRITISKGSYAPPNQPDILILRQGHRLTMVRPLKGLDSVDRDEVNDELVLGSLRERVAAGHHPTQRQVEEDRTKLGLSRDGVRAAVERLIDAGRVERRVIPNRGRGGAREYLHPTEGAPPPKQEEQPTGAAEAGFGAPFFASRLGDGAAARLSPPLLPDAVAAPLTNREPTAHPRTIYGGRT